MKNAKQISDTTLLNFMFRDCVNVQCFNSLYSTNFKAETGGDSVFSETPREALQELYILRKGKNDRNK